jgi:PAS domain S-box-containing protein
MADDVKIEAIAGPWKGIVDRVADGIVVFDRDWRYVYMNRAAEQHLGRPTEQFLGKTISELFPDYAGSELERQCLRAAAGTTPVEIELPSFAQKAWVKRTLYPSPAGVTVYFSDVTERRNVADALRESEERHRSIFDHSMDGVLLTKPTGEILAANPAACQMVQRTEEEICRLGRSGIVDLDDPRVAVLVEQRRRTGQMRGELTMIRKDGSRFPAEVASVTFPDRNGVLQTSLSFRDLTERKRVERDQALLAELGAIVKPVESEGALDEVALFLARQLADLVVFYVVQPDGELRRGAAACRDAAKAWISDELMKLPSTPAPDHPAQKVLRTRQACTFQFTPESMEAIAETPEHLRVIRGAALTSSLLVPLVVGESCVGVLGFSSTSASPSFDERDLPLALEIGRRCALFIRSARLYQSEKQATQTRDEMLGIVAHDLRNPLESIMLQTIVLRRPVEPERRMTKPIEAIERAAHRMASIIEDLLDVTTIEAGGLELEARRIAAGALVDEAADAQREQAVARSLALTTEIAPVALEVWADKKRILQVFENLVGNALKFTDHGGITLGARREGSEVVFSIADSGIGLAADDVAHLFDRFWQARKAGRSSVGLGLAIVKGIVEAHGGRIWVESQLGSGSTFHFSLPAASASRPSPTTGRWMAVAAGGQSAGAGARDP